MELNKSNCLVCGEPLVYWDQAREVTCHLCGKPGTAHETCRDGHYVCDACHRAKGVDNTIDCCLSSTSRDPIAIMNEAMTDPFVFANGPEHHTLIGAALITAYANAGGTGPAGEPFEKTAALMELKSRSAQVPGGACGFWGTCGAAVSAGQALSIITGSTPLAREPFAHCQRLTSLVLGRIADAGGPRCCKRNGYLAALTSVPFFNKLLGVSMELPSEVTCAFYAKNAQCLRKECPFFPAADDDVRAAFKPNAAKTS